MSHSSKQNIIALLNGTSYYKGLNYLLIEPTVKWGTVKLYCSNVVCYAYMYSFRKDIYYNRGQTAVLPPAVTNSTVLLESFLNFYYSA